MFILKLSVSWNATADACGSHTYIVYHSSCCSAAHPCVAAHDRSIKLNYSHARDPLDRGAIITEGAYHGEMYHAMGDRSLISAPLLYAARN
jgi:hypothetical protein